MPTLARCEIAQSQNGIDYRGCRKQYQGHRQKAGRTQDFRTFSGDKGKQRTVAEVQVRTIGEINNLATVAMQSDVNTLQKSMRAAETRAGSACQKPFLLALRERDNVKCTDRF